MRQKKEAGLLTEKEKQQIERKRQLDNERIKQKTKVLYEKEKQGTLSTEEKVRLARIRSSSKINKQMAREAQYERRRQGKLTEKDLQDMEKKREAERIRRSKYVAHAKRDDLSQEEKEKIEKKREKERAKHKRLRERDAKILQGLIINPVRLAQILEKKNKAALKKKRGSKKKVSETEETESKTEKTANKAEKAEIKTKKTKKQQTAEKPIQQTDHSEKPSTSSGICHTPGGLTHTAFLDTEDSDSSSSFIQNKASLKSLQNVFVSPVGNVEEAMEIAVLEMHVKEIPSYNKTESIPHNHLFGKLYPQTCNIRIFGEAPLYTETLKQKNQSICHVGLIIDHKDLVSVSLLYNYDKNTFNNQATHEQSYGTSKSTIESRNILAGASWNIHNSGITGAILAVYGFGTINNIRYLQHYDELFETKGRPNYHLKGNYIHLGYNIPITKTMTLTPFIGYSYIHMGWSKYIEQNEASHNTISDYSERHFKKNIGLRASLAIDKAKTNCWLIKNFKKQEKSGLSSSPREAVDPFYDLFIESHKEKDIKYELGLSYQREFTNDISFKVNATYSFNKNGTHVDRLAANLHYTF